MSSPPSPPAQPAAAAAPPEFSRPVTAAALADAALTDRTFSGAAEPAERAALAARYGVPAVLALSFRAHARPWGPGGLRVSGAVEATLRQTCVVTLEPVDTAVAEPFERFLAPPAKLAEAARLLDPELDEAPEPLGAAVDLGEIAAETAALAIDPYPRRPGAAFVGAVLGPPGTAAMTDEDARPFARLAALRRGDRER